MMNLESRIINFEDIGRLCVCVCACVLVHVLLCIVFMTFQTSYGTKSTSEFSGIVPTDR